MSSCPALKELSQLRVTDLKATLPWVARPLVRMYKTNKKNLVNYQAEASCPAAWGLTTSEIRWDLPTNIVITLPGGTWKQNRKSSISVPLPLAHGIKFQKFHQIFEECKIDVQSCSNPVYETINLNCYFQPSLPIISQDRVTFLQREDLSCWARERDVALVRSRMKRSVESVSKFPVQ